MQSAYFSYGSENEIFGWHLKIIAERAAVVKAGKAQIDNGEIAKVKIRESLK